MEEKIELKEKKPRSEKQIEAFKRAQESKFKCYQPHKTPTNFLR